MNWTSGSLTFAIAAAAVAQAVFAAKLFQFQRKLEHDRTRTSVIATLELRRLDLARPQQAWLRIENSSAVGIEHERLELMLTARGRSLGNDFLDMHMSVSPWSSREIEIRDEFVARAIKIDPADPAWNADAHTVFVMFKSHYAANGTQTVGNRSYYRVEFSAHNLQSAQAMTERAYQAVLAETVVVPTTPR
jgi:hypothetical protein